METADAMNKILRRFYPVDKLPADLQSGLPKHGWVHIEIDPQVSEPEARTIADHVATARNVHGDKTTTLNHIRSLREDR
jgi:hypothetical protein